MFEHFNPSLLPLNDATIARQIFRPKQGARQFQFLDKLIKYVVGALLLDIS